MSINSVLINDVSINNLIDWEDAKRCLKREELGLMIRNQRVLKINPHKLPDQISRDAAHKWAAEEIYQNRIRNFKDNWSVKLEVMGGLAHGVIYLTFMFLDTSDLETFDEILTLAKLSQD